MKRSLSATLFLALSLLAAAPARAVDIPFSGADWRHMTQSEKFACVLGSIIRLDREGVPFQNSPNMYIRQVDRLLAVHPELERADVLALLAKVVYEKEPPARPALLDLSARLHTAALTRSAMESSA
jgi:hypothetical protein